MESGDVGSAERTSIIAPSAHHNSTLHSPNSTLKNGGCQRIPRFSRILKGADRAALVFAAAVVALDDRAVGLADDAAEQEVVDGPVAHAHLLLVGLAVEEPGGGRLLHTTCPPPCVYAAYNALGGKDKAIRNVLGMTHSVNPDVRREMEEWLRAGR